MNKYDIILMGNVFDKFILLNLKYIFINPHYFVKFHKIIIKLNK